jgi:uncharacterized protein
MTHTPNYLYLHGFASSPRSAKVKYLADRFASRGLDLITPDLNDGGFKTLTVSRQIAQAEALLQPDRPNIVIGSSLGGLTAAWLAEGNPCIDRIILLAPAFDMGQYWLPTFEPGFLDNWERDGYRLFFHYAMGHPSPIHYQFAIDLAQYDRPHFQRQLPTRIIHGQQDNVIPLQASRDFADRHPWVELLPIDSDHSLGSAVSLIWREIQQFCDIPALL